MRASMQVNAWRERVRCWLKGGSGGERAGTGEVFLCGWSGEVLEVEGRGVLFAAFGELFLDLG